MLEAQVGPLLPSHGLVQLVKQCLHNAPDLRPTTDEVLGSLEGMRVEVEGVYGGSLVKLDINKILLAKEMRMKDKRLEDMEVKFKVPVKTARTHSVFIGQSRTTTE